MCLTMCTLKPYTKFCLNLSNSYGNETCRETENIRQLYFFVTRSLQRWNTKYYTKGSLRLCPASLPSSRKIITPATYAWLYFISFLTSFDAELYYALINYVYSVEVHISIFIANAFSSTNYFQQKKIFSWLTFCFREIWNYSHLHAWLPLWNYVNTLFWS